MVILMRATTRLWAPQALVLAAQPRAVSSFQHLLSSSALHTSTAVQQQRPSASVGGGKRVAQELRPYATVVPAAERLVVIGDVHGDIGKRNQGAGKWQSGSTAVDRRRDRLLRLL